jgi:predicted MFS family arabinose efflux permease
LALTSGAVGTFLIALAPTFFVFTVAALVMGTGNGLFFSPASSLISRLYDEYGGPLSMITAGGTFAGITYSAVGSAVAVQFGWRLAVFGSALAIVLFIMIAIWQLPSPETVATRRTIRESIGLKRLQSLLARRSILYTIVIATLVGFTFQAIATFYTTFLVEYRSVGLRQAGLLLAAIFGLSSVAQPVAGTLSDTFSRDLAIATSVALATVGLTTLLAVPGRSGLLVGTFILGLGIAWPGPLQARIMDQFSDERSGSGFGMLRTIYLLLASMANVIVGVTADMFGWLVSYGSLLGIWAVCILLLLGNKWLRLDL